jgi:hypothetical protein
MIAAVTHEKRFLLITAGILAAAVLGLYFLAQHIRYALADRPFVATISGELRSLVKGQTSFQTENRSFTTDVKRIWRAPADSTARGIRLLVLAADADGFIAEGRSDYWTGRCVVAVGRYTGDSLTAGEPVCHW